MSALVPPPIIPEPPTVDGPHSEAGASSSGLTRRTVLRLAGVGGALVAGGAWTYQQLWGFTAPGKGLKLFSDEELAIAEAIAEAFFPGPPASPVSARAAKVAEFVDGHVSGMFEAEQRLFKLIFRVVDLNAVLRHGRGFVRLPLEKRQALLQDWWTSRITTRRAGYQSLRYIFSMGYFENFKVRKALGLRFGCDLSHRFPELLGADVEG